MKNKLEESAFEISITTSCLPFLFVLYSLFETGEPYSFFIFASALIGGSFAGSILGILALIGNRCRKCRKTYILSLLPVFIFLLSVIADSVYSCKMP